MSPQKSSDGEPKYCGTSSYPRVDYYDGKILKNKEKVLCAFVSCQNYKNENIFEDFDMREGPGQHWYCAGCDLETTKGIFMKQIIIFIK